MKSKIEVKTITPKQAVEMLSNQFNHQRPLRPTYVEKLATDMAEGRWMLSTDAILIVKGQLANGQHRLNAVLRTGHSQTFIVMESDDDELFKVIDSGIKRTVGDVYGSDLPNARAVAATANLLVNYKTNQITLRAIQGNVSRGSVVEFIENNKNKLVSSVEFCSPIYSTHRLINLPLLAALHFLAKEQGMDEVEEFIVKVNSGGASNVSQDMHDRAVKNLTSTVKFGRAYMFGLLVKSFILFKRGLRPGVLKITESEEFPKL